MSPKEKSMKTVSNLDRSDLIDQKVSEANASGLTDVVVFALCHAQPCARAFYKKWRGHAMRRVDIGDGERGVLEAVSRDEAVRLLRLHAGNAGILLADSLRQELPAEYSDVWLGQDCSFVRTTTPRRWHLSLVWDFDAAVWWLHYSQRHSSQVTDSSFWRLQFLDGPNVPLCCPGTKEALEAAMLIDLARTRRYPDGREAFDQDMAADLLALKDLPCAIAEAIRALRKLGAGHERWLLDVLWSSANLRALARQVEHELTGIS
jgi:hypothetical protein